MSKDHEGDLKQYILVSEANYAESSLRSQKCIDEVNFGYYAPGGGTSGEMSVFWEVLGTKWEQGYRTTNVSPKLVCYDDAWHSLASFRDVLDAMAEVDDRDITPKQFCQILDTCGFTDRTPRKAEDEGDDAQH